ncbi:hypothetical protein ACLOJK_011855 [Asimina triloba]
MEVRSMPDRPTHGAFANSRKEEGRLPFFPPYKSRTNHEDAEVAVMLHKHRVQPPDLFCDALAAVYRASLGIRARHPNFELVENRKEQDREFSLHDALSQRQWIMLWKTNDRHKRTLAGAAKCNGLLEKGKKLALADCVAVICGAQLGVLIVNWKGKEQETNTNMLFHVHGFTWPFCCRSVLFFHGSRGSRLPCPFIWLFLVGHAICVIGLQCHLLSQVTVESPFQWRKRMMMDLEHQFLASGNIRRAGNFFFSGRASIISVARDHGTFRLPSDMRGLYSQYKIFSREFLPSSAGKAQENLLRTSYARKLSVLSASSSMKHHAQIAWRRLSHICSYSGPAFPPISRIACAASVAFTRSHLIPSVFAFIIGEVAWTQRTWADAETLPYMNSFYTRAQDGHIYFASFLFSVAEGFILLLRTLYLSILFFPALALAPFADSFGVQFRKMWLHLVHHTLERAGPAFIKWGQWAATRPDLFPRDLCNELAKLHSKAPAHSFNYTKRTIEKAFGRKLSEIFENFEETPVASGSVAQVHRASLRFRYPGQKVKPIVVAVKVRHPGVGESIKRDFTIINLVARISRLLPTLNWLRLDESVQQFAVFMMSQVDLAREAAHLSRFIYNFRRWKDVSFPKPLYPLVHPAVLVETYEQGESVSHIVDELEGHDRIKSALAHIGTHALLKMLLCNEYLVWIDARGKDVLQSNALQINDRQKVDNFIHADMHPGNILVRVSQGQSSRKRLFKSRPHVVFLDVGMTAELSKSDRVNLLEFFKAVALRDGHTAAKCTLRLSKQQNCPNPEAFVEEVGRSFKFWGTPEGDIVHPAECMQQLLETVRRHKVNIDGNVCTVMVTTLVLEGWQRKLDPDYDVMQTLRALLFKADWAESLFYTIEGLMAP